MGKAENAVTAELKQYLALKGAYVVRVQSGMVHVAQPGAKRGYYMHLAPKGTADLLGVYKGRAIAVEAKTDDGKQSPEQRAFQQAWEKAGGKYVIARSVEDLEQL